MSLGSRVKTWWSAIFQPQHLAVQVQEELEFHIESYADDLMRTGVPRSEALRRARAELGSVAAGKENCRQAWGTQFLDQLRADLRYAARMLARSPGFTAIAVGSLALGIGANTVIFTAAQHMLLDKLSVPHPDQLRLLWWTQPNSNGIVEEMWGWWDDNSAKNSEVSTSFSYPVYQQLRAHNRSMQELFAFKPLNQQTVAVNGKAEALDAEMVSGNYFSGLGIQPELGRAIDEADDAGPGSGPVAMISDRFWTTHFGRSADVIGKTVLVNTKPLTIVGVAPKGFTGAYSAQGTTDVFFPFSMQPVVAPPEFMPDKSGKSLLTNTTLWWVLVMGRTKSGVPDAQAAAELDVSLSAAVRATMPAKDKVLPRLLLMDGSRGQNPSAENLAKPLYVLMGLAGFVLLLACANLANLLLARASARQREMSVRMAMGAGRWRVVRQMLTESLTISALGGATGLGIAYAVRDGIPKLLSRAWMPPAFSATFDWRIFGFAVAISVATGLVFGLAPAWVATRVEVSSGLKDAAQTATHRRRGLAGTALVALQVALSMLLVVGAGLFTRTLMELGHTKVGFRTDNLLLFSIIPPQARYPQGAVTPLYRELEEKLAAIPGVKAEALVKQALIAHNVSFATLVPEGLARKSNGQNPSESYNDVGTSFFSTFGIAIVGGRGFDATDTLTSRKVAVINQALAKKYFPNVDPIGRTFEMGYHEPIQIEIVGVCADTMYSGLRDGTPPQFFLPYWQEKDGIGRATFVLQSRMDRKALVDAVRKVVAGVDSNLPLLDIRTQNEQIAATMQQERVFADLTAAFGVLALVLAAIGIYGILAYSVSRKTNEIGIRMALGARSGQVMRMVLGEAAWMTGIGIAAGLGGALALGRVVASLLYGLKPWDPLTLTAAAAVLVLVSIAASWIPARRAAGIDPMKALRHE
jgi:predicted permease